MNFFAVLILVTSAVQGNTSPKYQHHHQHRAGQFDQSCEAILGGTLPDLITRAQNNQEQYRLKNKLPLRTFSHPVIDAKRVEDGIKGPTLLAGMNPNNVRFQAVQSVFPETPVVMKADSQQNAMKERIETLYEGVKIRTSATFSTAVRMRPESSGYLVGPEFKDVGITVWFHGGGTPTAVGDNGMSVPGNILAIDLPNHGGSDIFNFVSGEDMIRYLLEVMRQHIHPDVPIVIAGHSWGGQFAIQMYLMWGRLTEWYAEQSRRDPNVHMPRVKGLISLSPPADLSLGQGAVARAQAERALDKNRMDWLCRAAESDQAFILNTVENGKVAPANGAACAISNLDYEWKVPTDGIERPRLMVLMGDRDGLVFVGREKAFFEFLPKITRKGDFVLMKVGRTFDGSAVQTGHNIFDRYLDPRTGDYMDPETLQAWRSFLGPEADKEDVREVYARIKKFMTEQVGPQTPFGNRGEIENNSLESTLNDIYRLYSYNLAFREHLSTYIYRGFVKTEDSRRIPERKNVLGKYLGEVQNAQKIIRAEVENGFNKRKKDFESKYQVRSLFAAEKQLDMAQKPEAEQAKRRAELETFVKSAKPIREQVIKEYPDHTESQILELASKPKDIQSVAQAQAELSSSSGNKERRAQLNKFLKEANDIVGGYRADLGRRISAAVEREVRPPTGVRTVAEAESELAWDLSPKRVEDLRAYIQGAQSLEKELEEAKADDFLKAAVQRAPLPSGSKSFAEAKAEWEKLTALLSGTYVPDGPGAATVQKILARTVQTSNSIRDIGILLRGSLKDGNETKGVLKELDEFKKERMRVRDKLNVRFAQMQNESLHSDLHEEFRLRQAALTEYMDANAQISEFVEDRLAREHEKGGLSRDEVRKIYEEMTPFADAFDRAREGFLRAKARFEGRRMNLAKNGALGDEVRALALALEDLDHKVQSRTENRNRLLKIEADLRAEEFDLRKKYAEHVPGYEKVIVIPVAPLFELPLSELEARLRDPSIGGETLNALKRMLKDFNDMWKTRDVPDKKGSEIN